MTGTYSCYVSVRVLSFAGRYEIGVIDADDAVDVEEGSGSTSRITTSDWTTSSSSRSSINVVEGDLSGNFLTVNGQVAEEDGFLDVDGTAAGQNDVVVAFVDDRGNTEAYEISVDDDQTFEEEDVATLCTLGVDDHAPDGGTRRFMLGGEPVKDPATGEVLVDDEGRRSYTTSAATGPSVGKHLLLAYLPREYAEEGRQLEVEYMGQDYPVTVERVGSKPLFDPENERIRS